MKLIHLRMLCFAFTILLCLSSCYDAFQTQDGSNTAEHDFSAISISEQQLSGDLLSVHYLDVGQGDSIFIEFPDNRCMLIDASISSYEEIIAESITQLGYTKIDYVVATHPHADHIGGMKHILETFEIGCIYMPDVSTTTKTYTSLVETILEKEIEANIAEAGVTVFEEDDIRVEFLAPYEIDESDQNKNSAVLYLVYQEISFLFMGDADSDIERQIGEVDCDVLKVGHHGSRTASDSLFLRDASPLYAIISCGEGNSYGHPHQEAVDRLTTCGASILRTDLLGKITVCTNGTEIAVYYGECSIFEQSQSAEESPAESSWDFFDEAEASINQTKWILNTNTQKIHTLGCRYAKDLSEKNKKETTATIAELIEKGYTPCSICAPND